MSRIIWISPVSPKNIMSGEHFCYLIFFHNFNSSNTLHTLFLITKCNYFHRVWKKKLHDRTDTAPHTPMMISKCLGKNNIDSIFLVKVITYYIWYFLTFSDKFAKEPFKYYVIMFLTFLGPPNQLWWFIAETWPLYLSSISILTKYQYTDNYT